MKLKIITQNLYGATVAVKRVDDIELKITGRSYLMSSTYNGRIVVVQNESSLLVAWNEGIYDMDAYAIPKGARNSPEGIRFIQFVLQTDVQRAFVQQIAYGPVNWTAVPLVDAARRSNVPTDEVNLAPGGYERIFLGRSWRAVGAALQFLRRQKIY